MANLRSLLRSRRNRRRILRDAAFFNELSPVLDFTPINNVAQSRPAILTFVVPTMAVHAGGATSVFRLGTLLSERGYAVRYACYSQQSGSDLASIARRNLAGYRGECFGREALQMHSDVWIATFWESVYHIKGLPGYKMYFVQDYEPYFYPYGDKYLLAQKTYELGLHMVSLGEWNAKRIRHHSAAHGRIDSISFPYEPSEYPLVARDFPAYAQRHCFTVAVYLKNSERRAPLVIPEMLGIARRLLAESGIELKVKYFGEGRDYPYPNGEALGKLDKRALASVYAACDFGMVASLTNISLVPYEMLASGLPLIEFSEGTFSSFFPSGAAILTTFSGYDLAKRLLHVMRHPDELARMIALATHHLSNLNWARTADEFDRALRDACTEVRA